VCIEWKPRADLYIDDCATVPAWGATDDDRHTLAIGVSGGLDSTAAYLWAQLVEGVPRDEIKAVFFNLGQPYAEKELETLSTLPIAFETVELPLVEMQNTKPTVESHVIPARNLVIASYLAAIAKRVWIVGVKHEQHRFMFDKNPRFYATASHAATQAAGAPTIIETPFADMEKADLIRWARQVGHQDTLAKTISCHDPKLKHCGRCHPCVKRYVAYYLAGEDTAELYEEHPLRSTEGGHFMVRYMKAITQKDYSHYTPERIAEHFAVVLMENGHG